MFLIGQQPPDSKTQAFVIRIPPDVSAELRRGIEFGFDEMQHTAQLMRRTIVITTDSSASSSAMIIASTGAPVPAGDTIARIHIAPLPSGAEACEFSVAPADSKNDRQVVAWDASLDRFGASELNERFERKYRTGMSGAAYLGWVAVKALVEAELRRKPDEDYCKTLAGLRFDGHKGRPLFFDPATRSLSQPLYLVKDGKVVGEIR
jgi:hypothetical protein